MKIQKTNGIVLSSRTLGEADVSACVYTKDFGKRNYIFKNIKNSKARPLCVSQPGTVAEFTYYHSDSGKGSIVSEFSVLDYPDGVGSDLEKVSCLYFMLELVSKTCGENDKQTYVYNILRAATETLRTTFYPVHLALFFALHVSKFHGIMPPAVCVSCGNNISGSFAFNFNDKSLICGNCASSSAKRMKVLPATAMSYMESAYRNKFGSIDHSFLDGKTTEEFLYCLSLYLENYYGTNFHSKSLLFSEKMKSND